MLNKFKFSIVGIYWGDAAPLKAYIDHALTITDNVCIGFIDLIDYNSIDDLFLDYNRDGITVTKVDLPFDMLLKRGFADAYNAVFPITEYEWSYSLAVGKRIVKLENDLLNNIPDNVVGFQCQEEGNERDQWFKLVNTRKTAWCGKIHEEPFPIKFNQEDNHFEQKAALTWKREDYQYGTEKVKWICENYRTLAHVKWLHELAIGNYRYGTNNYWWLNYGRKDLIEQLYDKHKEAYTMNKTNLLRYLETCENQKYF